MPQPSPDSEFPRLHLYLLQGQGYSAVVLVHGTVPFACFFPRDLWRLSWAFESMNCMLEVKNLLFTANETKVDLDFRFKKKMELYPYMYVWLLVECKCMCVSFLLVLMMWKDLFLEFSRM